MYGVMTVTFSLPVLLPGALSLTLCSTLANNRCAPSLVGTQSNQTELPAAPMLPMDTSLPAISSPPWSGSPS